MKKFMEITNLCPLFMVFDMETSLRFYVDILGFKVHESAGKKNDIGWVWLKRNELNLMLNTQFELSDRPQHAEASRTKARNDIILYLGCSDVDAAYLEMIANGIKCDPPAVASYGMKQLYISDPDGYGICFQWPHDIKS